MGALIFRRLLLAGLMVGYLSVTTPVILAEEPPVHASRITTTIPVSYLSAFSSYRAYKEQPVLSWPAANDQAGRIGGWRFYVREGQQPAGDTTALDPGAAVTKPPLLPAANSDQHHEHGSRP